MSTHPLAQPPITDLVEALAACLPAAAHPATLPRLWWREPGGVIHLLECAERTRGLFEDAAEGDVQVHSSLLALLVEDALTSACCAPPDALLLQAAPQVALVTLAATSYRLRDLLETLALEYLDTPSAAMIRAQIFIEIITTLTFQRAVLPSAGGTLRTLALRVHERARSVVARELTSGSPTLAQVLEDVADDMDPECAAHIVTGLLAAAPGALAPDRPRLHLVVSRLSLRTRDEVTLAWCVGVELVEAADCVLLEIDAAAARALAPSPHLLVIDSLQHCTFEERVERARLALEMRPELAARLHDRTPLDEELRTLVEDSLDAAARALAH